jgi:hypothetical protein
MLRAERNGAPMASFRRFSPPAGDHDPRGQRQSPAGVSRCTGLGLGGPGGCMTDVTPCGAAHLSSAGAVGRSPLRLLIASGLARDAGRCPHRLDSIRTQPKRRAGAHCFDGHDVFRVSRVKEPPSSLGGTRPSYHPCVPSTARALLTAAIVALSSRFCTWAGEGVAWRTTPRISPSPSRLRAHRLLGHNPYDAAVLNRRSPSRAVRTWPAALLDLLLNVYFQPRCRSTPSHLLRGRSQMRAGGVMSAPRYSLPRGGPSARMAPHVMASVDADGLLSRVGTRGHLRRRRQTGIVAIAAIVAAMLLERSGHGRASGAFTGWRPWSKIQDRPPVRGLPVLRRRWSPAVWSCLVVAARRGSQRSGCRWLRRHG